MPKKRLFSLPFFRPCNGQIRPHSPRMSDYHTEVAERWRKEDRQGRSVSEGESTGLSDKPSMGRGRGKRRVDAGAKALAG